MILRKIIILIYIFTIFCFLATSQICQAAEKYVRGELIVKFKENLSTLAFEQSQGKKSKTMSSVLSKLQNRYGIKSMNRVFKELQNPDLKIINRTTFLSYLSKRKNQNVLSKSLKDISKLPNLYNIYRLVLKDKSVDMEALAKEYEYEPNVEYAHPNYILELAAVPNDSLYNQQWAHQKIFSEPGWDIEKGSADVVIAVIDTGVDWDHPDLAANIWTNTGEISGNGIDDDNNGYIDDVRGWDFIWQVFDETNYYAPGEDIGIPDNDPMDFYGHGTIVAGVAGAVGNNGIGISGTAWNCKIMPLRVGVEMRFGDIYIISEWCANAFYYAANQGADVINFSIIDRNWPGVVKDAIDFAYIQGSVIVGPAGNYGSAYPSYPAAYDKVIGVAATDTNNQRSIWGTPQPPLYQGCESDYGTWVNVAAPGTSILSTAFDDTYSTANGTSLSTAFVSGLAALIRSHYPTFNNADIMKVIYSTTDPVDSDKYIGSGRINVERALQMSAIPIAQITSPVMEYTIADNINIIGSAGGSGFDSYILKYGERLYPAVWTTIQNGSQPVTDGILGTWDVSLIQDNIPYTLRLTVTDTSGNTSVSEVLVYVQKSVQSGWPIAISNVNITGDGIAVGDIDNNGDLEIAVVGRRTLAGSQLIHDLYVFNHDGSTVMGWPITGVNRFISAPTLADLTGNGDLEVILSGYDLGPPDSITKFHVFDHTGNYLPGWPVTFISNHGILSSTPSVGDLDNDGNLEIVFTSKRDSRADIAMIFVYRFDGTTLPGWPKVFDLQYPPATGSADDQAGHACLVDLDKDGDLEIVVALGFYKNSKVYAFHHDGTIFNGWPVTLPDGYTLRLVAGDIDNDGCMEIVGSTGNGKMYAWKTNAAACTGWPFDLPSGGATPPVLADLDNNGDLEIILHSAADKVFAYHHDASPVSGWPVDVEQRAGNSVWPTALVADIDGDNNPEIIQASGDEACIYAWHADGLPVTDWPKIIPQATSVSPLLWDMNGNGNLDIVMAYNNTINLWDMSTPFQKSSLQWPMSWFNMHHTGAYFFDLIDPIVSITSPTQGSIVKGQVYIDADATDNIGVKGVQFRLDGANLGDEDTTAPYSIIWDTTLTANGPHVLTAIARDTANNQGNSGSINVFVQNTDLIPPNFTNLLPTNNAVNIATNENIVFNIFDNVSAVSQSIIVRVDGTTALSNGSALAGYSAIIYSSNIGWNVLVNPDNPFSENTTINVYAYGKDNEANTNSITWSFTTVDLTVPYFTNLSPTNNAVNIATNENIVFNIFDNVSAVSQSIIVRVDGTTALSNGSALAGYSAIIYSSNIGWNVLVNPDNPFSDNTTINVYAYGEDNEAKINSITWSFTTIDLTVPSVYITSPSSASTVYDKVCITAQASDNIGVSGVQFRLDGANLGDENTTAPYSIIWDTTLTANGSHVLTAIARDTVNNKTISGDINIIIDNILLLSMISVGEIKIIGSTEGRGTINPDKGETGKIYFKGKGIGEFECRIFSLAGELIWEDIIRHTSKGMFEWKPKKNTASGIYIAHVKGEGIETYKKIVILR